MDKVDSVVEGCAQNPIDLLAKSSNRRHKVRVLVCLFLLGGAWDAATHVSSEGEIAGQTLTTQDCRIAGGVRQVW